MVIFIIRFLINALAIYLTAQIMTSVQLDGLQSALIVALVLGIVNAIIKPILLFLTLPITVITLGLFTFVINAGMVLLTAYLVDGFTVPDFWSALIFSIILSIVSSVLTWIAK